MQTLLKRLTLAGTTIFVVLLGSCSDTGSEPPPPPVITSVQPASASVGDTVHVLGSGFGTARGTGTVTIGGTLVQIYHSWSDGEILVAVPGGASDGPLVVTVSGIASNDYAFSVAGGGGQTGVSFTNDVHPILTMGCAISGCHVLPSPRSGFDQSSYAGLRAGGQKFGSQVVVAGDSANSRIIQAMRGTAPGLGRMPFGGPWVSTGVPDSLIHTIAVWIQEGAADN